MRYGKVLSMMTEDNGLGRSAIVTVRFRVRRSVIYEFMDMIIPADGHAVREPVAAILDHRAKDVEWAIPEEDLRRALDAQDAVKPCPFCGGEAKFKGKHFLEEPSRYWIECRECHASMESVDDMEKTIAAWNKRAERTCRYIVDPDTSVELCSECGALAIEDWTADYCWACGSKVVG